MKILFIVNGLGTGGAERSLSEMLPLLMQAGMEATICCLNRRTEGVEDLLRDGGFDVRFIRSGHSMLRVSDIRAIARQVHPDLVHTTLFEPDVIGRLAAMGTGVPVLTSLVNTSYEPVRLRDPNVRPWRLRAVKTIDGLTARGLTTHFHAVSQAVKNAAVRDLRVRPENITVIERGRDPERLGRPDTERRARARRALGIRAEDLVLVTVGRQEFQKGQWHLLEALPKLVADHPNLRLLVAGRRGNASERIGATMRDSGLNGQVRFLGHRDDVPEILAAADLFVFPSLYEGLGGALIEAMALGLPIVASDLPAIREVVEPEENALLVPAGSAPALAGAVDALVNSEPRRRSMGIRSREIFEERFTLERSTSRMIELFERVGASRGRVSIGVKRWQT